MTISGIDVRMNLTAEELRFLYELLDRVSVSGPQAKAMVLGIMLKLAEERGAKTAIDDLASSAEHKPQPE